MSETEPSDPTKAQPDGFERAALVANIRAILALPAMDGPERTRVRRAVFASLARDRFQEHPEPVEVRSVDLSANGTVTLWLVEVGDTRAHRIPTGDAPPEWWTALVPVP